MDGLAGLEENMVELEAVSGRRVGKKRLEAAKAELERIRLKYGKLTSALVLRETMVLGRKRSPIAWAFDWDVKSAARRFWLNQAGHLIREVQVQLVRSPESDQPTHPFKMYSFIREPHGGQYVPTAEALSQPQIRQHLLQQALQDVTAMKRKYALLSWLTTELAGLEATMRKRKRKSA